MPRFEINPEFVHELVQSDAVLDLLDEIGPTIVEAAKAEARQHRYTGDFEASIKGDLQLSPRQDRPYYRVWSDDPASLAIEFGAMATRHQEGKHCLRNAIIRIGSQHVSE